MSHIYQVILNWASQICVQIKFSIYMNTHALCNAWQYVKCCVDCMEDMHIYVSHIWPIITFHFSCMSNYERNYIFYFMNTRWCYFIMLANRWRHVRRPAAVFRRERGGTCVGRRNEVRQHNPQHIMIKCEKLHSLLSFKHLRRSQAYF